MLHQRRFHAVLKTVLGIKWRDTGKTLQVALQHVADAAVAARDEPLTTNELSTIAAFLRKADPYPGVAARLMHELLTFPRHDVVHTLGVDAPPAPARAQQLATNEPIVSAIVHLLVYDGWGRCPRGVIKALQMLAALQPCVIRLCLSSPGGGALPAKLVQIAAHYSAFDCSSDASWAAAALNVLAAMVILDGGQGLQPGVDGLLPQDVLQLPELLPTTARCLAHREASARMAAADVMRVAACSYQPQIALIIARQPGLVTGMLAALRQPIQFSAVDAVSSNIGRSSSSGGAGSGGGRSASSRGSGRPSCSGSCSCSDGGCSECNSSSSDLGLTAAGRSQAALAILSNCTGSLTMLAAFPDSAAVLLSHPRVLESLAAAVDQLRRPPLRDMKRAAFAIDLMIKCKDKAEAAGRPFADKAGMQRAVKSMGPLLFETATVTGDLGDICTTAAAALLRLAMDADSLGKHLAVVLSSSYVRSALPVLLLGSHPSGAAPGLTQEQILHRGFAAVSLLTAPFNTRNAFDSSSAAIMAVLRSVATLRAAVQALVACARWLGQQPRGGGLSSGGSSTLFGVSSGSIGGGGGGLVPPQLGDVRKVRQMVLMLLRHFVMLTASEDARAKLGAAIVARVRQVLLEEEAAVEGALRVVEHKMSADPQAWAPLIADIGGFSFEGVGGSQPDVYVRDLKAWWQLVKGWQGTRDKQGGGGTTSESTTGASSGDVPAAGDQAAGVAVTEAGVGEGVSGGLGVDAPLRECGGCGKAASSKGVKLRACAKCNEVLYCSVECQRKAWPLHKIICRQQSAMLAAK